MEMPSDIHPLFTSSTLKLDPCVGASDRMEQAEIRVRGRVQGVGFRPAVWRLAQELGLSGEVPNDAEGVLIRAAGGSGAIAALIEHLRNTPPPLARIERIERSPGAGRARPAFASSTACRVPRAPRSPPMPPSAPHVHTKCWTRRSAAIAMPSPTARIADPASASSAGSRMTAPPRPWRPSRCAMPVMANTDDPGRPAFPCRGHRVSCLRAPRRDPLDEQTIPSR